MKKKMDYIASYEEKLLEGRFHEEYRTYKKRTGKRVPMIGREGLAGG
jgi:protein-S-isoprenylcysteine O-methyltransferase Ste14